MVFAKLTCFTLKEIYISKILDLTFQKKKREMTKAVMPFKSK